MDNIFISAGISQGFTLHFTVLHIVKDTKKNVVSNRNQCLSKSCLLAQRKDYYIAIKNAEHQNHLARKTVFC